MNSLLTAVIAGALLCGLSIGASHAETVLSYSPWAGSFVPETVMRQYFADIEVQTEGRVRIEPRAAMVGKGATEQFDVVANGLTDLAMVVPGYTPGRFPLLELAEFPFVSADHTEAAAKFYDTFNDNIAPLEPFKGVKTLSIWLIPAQNIVTLNQKITKLDQLKGMKLRSPNPGSSLTMRSLGAVPVATGGDQLFEMASTGMIDGAFFNYQAMFTFNVAQYLREFTTVPGGMTSGSNAILINQEKWDSIDKKDQDIISALSGRALSIRVSEIWAKEEMAAKAELEKVGVSFTDLPADQLLALREIVKPNVEDWIEKATKLGLGNAKEIIDDMQN